MAFRIKTGYFICLYSRFGVLEASCGRVTLDGRLDEPVPIDKHKGTYGCPRDKTVRLS